MFRDLFQILRMQNNFFEFCSVHHFLYINCSHLCYFKQLCNKDCIWSSENEILILEVLERCVLHCIRDLTPDELLPHRLQYIRCPIHGAPQTFSPHLLPIQSGYRIISLDGGGVKGLTQLVILRHIKKKCFDVPVIYLFDLVIGSSMGGQIALALTIGKSSGSLTVAVAMDEFPDFMRRTFEERFPPLPAASLLVNKTQYKVT